MAEKLLEELVASGSLKEAFRRQLRDFPEIYWVAMQIPDGDYARAYQNATLHLAAIKTCRVFSPLEKQARKGSLTGEHNALFYREKRIPNGSKLQGGFCSTGPGPRVRISAPR